MVRRVVGGGVTADQIYNSTYTYAADAEANDSYAITISDGPSAYAAGQKFSFLANTANTGASTLNVNSIGAVALKKNNDQDTETGDIEAGQVITVVYDGTFFQIQSTSGQALDAADIGVTVQGVLAEGAFVDGDKTKLDGIETAADVTDATNVVSSLNGATISTATVATGDKVLVQDADDSDNLKTVTAQSIADLASGGVNAVFAQHNAVIAAKNSSAQFHTSVGFPRNVSEFAANTASVAYAYYINGLRLNAAGGGHFDMNVLSPSGGGSAQWNDGKDMCATIAIQFPSDTTASNGFGFTQGATDFDSGAATNVRVGLAMRSGPSAKFVSADGTTLTESADLDATFSYDTTVVVTMYLDTANNQATIYINDPTAASGTTITTSNCFSQTDVVRWGHSFGSASGDHYVGEFLLSYEI